LFNAADAGRLGISLHSVEYTLAPAANIGQMVTECVDSIVAVIAKHSPRRVVLSGCSAGAHLAAMSAMKAAVATHLDGVALLSGIFDVRPFTRVSDNEALQLTVEAATAVSPLLMEIPHFSPHALCAVGTAESSEFIRQSIDMADHLKRHGVQATSAVVPDRDHFNLPYDLLREGTVVGDWVLNILQH
jgi:arylformamidase